jgi:hypothetical protein
MFFDAVIADSLERIDAHNSNKTDNRQAQVSEFLE